MRTRDPRSWNRGSLLRRREFLKTGVLASIELGVNRSRILPSASGAMKECSVADLLKTNVVWASESIPVPLREGGAASAIAGQGSPESEADLHAVFLKDLSLSRTPATAELHLFAYTRYQLYVNGHYAGRGPSRFQNQRPEYDTRDIAQYLRTGRNRVAVLVHRDAPTGRIMHHDPGLAAVLDWSEPGGARKRIITDATWRGRADLSFGSRDRAWSSVEEHIDARQTGNWRDLDYDASQWPSPVPARGSDLVQLWPRTTPLQFETKKEWRSGAGPLPVTLSAPAEANFELGEIIQGYHVLEFDADEGSELVVNYLLPEGQQSGANTYIARAGLQAYVGGDTFALNRLSVHIKSGRIRLTNAQIFEVRYPFERIGSFDSSDSFLNRLWILSARTLEVLSEDAYVDCADRERVEWTDCSPPAFDCTRTMMAGPGTSGGKQWSDARLLKALLRRIALTQQADGQIKAHSCSDRWDIHAIMEDRSCDWVIQLREYFESTADQELVVELWPSVSRLMNWFLSRRTERGLVLAREWEVWDNPLRYQVCEGAGLNAFVYRALRDASYLGHFIGKRAEGADLAAAADRLAEAYNTLLWDPQEGSYYGALFGPGSKMNPRLNGPIFAGPIVDGHYEPTAQAALFALYCGIVPDDRLQAVCSWVLSHQGEVTGPMSHYYLFLALYTLREEQQDSRVLDLIHSGWMNQMKSPWQTAWEDLSDKGGSKVHIYGIGPGYFLSAYVLGVRRDGPLWNKSILVEPRAGNLPRARGVVVTEFGPVPISWTRNREGAMSVDFTAPPGTSAIVRLPRGTGLRSLQVDGKVQEAQFNPPYLTLSLPEGQHTIKPID